VIRDVFHHRAFLLVLVLLAVSALGLSAAMSAYKIHLKKLPIYAPENRQLMALPKETATWRAVGSDVRVDADIEKTLGTTNYISRHYVKKTKDGDTPVALELHCAYYTGMIDTVPHVPDRCFVGGGHQIGEVLGNLELPLDRSLWRPDLDAPTGMEGRIFKMRTSYEAAFSIQPASDQRLPRDPGDIRLRTMKFLNKEGEPYFSGYFFIANGGAVSRAEDVRQLAFDLQSTYAYYLKVQFTSTTAKTGEEFTAAAADLLNELFPEIMLCTPDWIEVEAGRYPPAKNAGPADPAGAP
jgi:hypothetical protein